MNLVPSLSVDHLLRKKRYWVPFINVELREIRMIFMGHVIGKRLIQNHLIKDSINSIPQSISFNPDMTLQIQMPKNRSLDKSFA